MIIANAGEDMENENPHTLLADVQIGTITRENTSKYTDKLKRSLP